MSQSGALSSNGSGASVVETLTGNTGGPVGPDASHNINVIANTVLGITTVGNPGTNTINIVGIQSSTTQIGVIQLATSAQVISGTNSTNAIVPSTLAPMLISQYIVGPTAAYTTIQSALDAANAAGGDATVFIRPGNYTENLTLYDGIQLVGATGISQNEADGINITGVHTPPLAGHTVLRNLHLLSATDIFQSNAAGTCHIHIVDSETGVTNGWTFNLPNWTGTLEIENCNPNSGATNDGCINNTAGAAVVVFNAGMGAGTGKTCTISGFCIIESCEIAPPVNFVTGTQLAIQWITFDSTVTFSNNTFGICYYCSFIPGSGAAVIMNSSGNIDLSTCLFDSSNNPCIDGNGAGTLTINNVTYQNNKNIAGTVTIGYATAVEVGDLYAQNISFDRGTTTISTNGQLIIGNTGNNPSISTLTAGAGISIANGAGSITISSTGSISWSDQSGAFTPAAGNGYFITGTSTANLPGSPSQGDTIRFIVDTANILTITANTGQVIRLGTAVSAAASTCASNARGDAITLVYRSTGTAWIALDSVGTWTITS